MEYETPTLDLVGSASKLIQAYAGPRMDGDAYQFSQGFTCGPQEE
jgi:hypothetical protein